MPENNGARVLIVEDETSIRSGLRDILIKNGFQVQEARSAEEALPFLQASRFEAAIVDIRMPGISGIDLLEIVRSRWPDLSVVILTGHGTLDSARVAVRSGAYDYLLKPAMPEEILNVVSQAVALCQRKREESRLLDAIRQGIQRLDSINEDGKFPSAQLAGSRRLQLGRLQIDLAAHSVLQDGEPLHLTLSEFNLLLALASRVGEAVDYMELAHLALGYEAEIWEAKELIKRHIFTLRQKVENDPSSPDHIVNVRGIGYRLVPA